MPHLEIQEQLAETSSLQILSWHMHIDCENALSQLRLSFLENFQILFKMNGSGSRIRRF